LGECAGDGNPLLLATRQAGCALGCPEIHANAVQAFQGQGFFFGVEQTEAATPTGHAAQSAGEHIGYDPHAADKVELLTNASLLTREKGDELLRAGLDRLVVSVQGTTREKYKEICGTDIDFEAFLANLKYFYENRKKTEVYIKVVDTALDNQKDQERFFEFFGNYCDTIAVEYTVPIHKGIDYHNVIGHESRKTQFGLPVKDVKICPQPFFTMQINPDGKIVPCYSFEYPEFMGDCNTESVTDIWKGETFRNFRRRMLDGMENASAICKDCSITKYRQFPEDDLSKNAERLKKYYE
jgi:radical SAM protein with 4Fe4S-binding SPASM domain